MRSPREGGRKASRVSMNHGPAKYVPPAWVWDGTAHPYRSYSTKVGLRILALTQQVRAIHTNVVPIKTPLELNAKSWKEA